MVVSLLDLADEALRLIFLALGSDILTDSSDARPSIQNDARSLSNCSRRLHAIYRTSVRTLQLLNSYSVSSCARLWDRFPHIAALSLLFDGVPGFDLNDFPPETMPLPWHGEPGAFPNGLVRNGIKSIQLQYGSVHVRELQEMLENCIGLEELNLDNFEVCLDREKAQYTDEMCTFSLERHAESLKKLVLCHAAVQTASGDDERSVDLRWLNLPAMSSLVHLELNSIATCGYSIPDLPALPSLEYLSLVNLEIEDEDLEAILPSLPRLHSVNVCYCEKLTYRVLQLLPSHLEFLNVSCSDILTLPPGVEEVEEMDFLSHASWGRRETGSVKTLEVEVQLMGVNQRPRFDLFLHLFDGASITHLILNYSDLSSSCFVYLLSKAPHLLELELGGVDDLDEESFRSISKLASLRELDLSKTHTTDEWLALLATGPCRMSLRLINLKNCTEIEDEAGARRLISELFHSCDLRF